ncbi:hypothetical protein BURK2_01685 [Burkholderiales bacterium]|nr:hypothetical protein BURK2_01685 [Burkholderiales bacterium]
MNKIILDRRLQSDPWSRPESPGEVHPRAEVLIPFAWWQAERARWLAHEGRLGVVLPADADPGTLAPDLRYWSLVAIEFLRHADGRGFSLARLLRERYDYCGELRAVGDVLQDQLFYLSRCGFNAFALRADRDIEDALRSLDDFSEGYQASVERPVPLFRRRFSEEAIHG